MRLATAMGSMVFLLSACLAPPSANEASSEICGFWEPPPSVPPPPGATPFTPLRPTPGATPARVVGPLAQDGWETYRTFTYAALAEHVGSAVISDQAAWDCFFRIQHGGDATFQPISFDRDRILFVTSGAQATLGHAIHVHDIARNDSVYDVSYSTITPGPGCPLSDDFGPHAPSVLLRHHPADPTLAYTFREAEPLVYPCGSVVPRHERGEPTAFEIVSRNDTSTNRFSGFHAPVLFVFDRPMPWHPYAADAHEPFSDEDFAHRSFVLFTVGYRPSLGYELTLANVTRAGSEVHLAFDERKAGEMCIIRGAVDSPFVALWVERQGMDALRVTASLSSRTINCA